MRRLSCLALIIGILAMPLGAYEYPFSDTAIREAYFLGAGNNAHTRTFLAHYTHSLPMPTSGPHVASITLETPYAQIVEYSSTALNFSAVDAVQEFLNAPARMRVRVQIDLTGSYTPIVSSDATGAHLRSPDFWQDFRVNLKQAGQAIPQRSVSGEPLYDSIADGSATLRGAVMTLEYSAKKITSAPTMVEVVTPDGQQVQSEFDLSQLQ